MDNNEIPKYRKKKPSKSKSASKSNHKHQYEDCLLVDDEKHPHKAEYCIICGKINNVKTFETDRLDGGRFRMLDYDDFKKKLEDWRVNAVISNIPNSESKIEKIGNHVYFMPKE